MFQKNDLQQFKNKGIAEKTVATQIQNFITGFPFMPITKAATPASGLLQLSDNEIDSYIQKFETNKNSYSLLKFVPASGAASRMFKALFEFAENYQPEQQANFLNDKSFNSIYTFFSRLKDFAFYPDLEQVLKRNNLNINELIEKKDFVPIVKALLFENGLNYGNSPKGLLKFHAYSDAAARTPVAEHLVEGALYGSSNSQSRIEFTVSPEHRSAFEKEVQSLVNQLESKYNIKYSIQFSEQKSSTDTIAVDMENHPFRNADGSILFRPGGHGALIENLNDLDADIVFVKNIDNVVPDKLKPDTVRYKKLIAGLLIDYQQITFAYLKEIEQGDVSDKQAEAMLQFLESELFTIPKQAFKTKQEKLNYLKTKLNRPIRVCGMVKNEGEPGGGPYWAINADGSESLQIVESSQIDTKSPDKQAIMKNATHFNPVDLVCGIKDYRGQAFDLLHFTDPKTGFISYKSKDGKELKAQELPGLWNGAMADWNTIFVEVPISTFNPVKVVSDLLREQHQ